MGGGGLLGGEVGGSQTAIVPPRRLTERETGQQALHFGHVKTPFMHQITRGAEFTASQRSIEDRARIRQGMAEAILPFRIHFLSFGSKSHDSSDHLPGLRGTEVPLVF